MLVLSRVGAALMLLPGFGETEPPAMLRAGLALCFTVLLLPLVQPLLPPPPTDALTVAAMVAGELLAGGLLGFLARLVALALPIAGQIASYMTGLSSVLQPDPVLGSQASAISRLLGLCAPVLFLASGLYALPLSALAGSYRLFPPGQGPLAGDAAAGVVASVGQAFALALRLAAPFVVGGVLWQVGLGLLARFVPPLHVSSVLQPAQILGGLLLLALSAAAILAVWGDAARTVLSALPGL